MVDFMQRYFEQIFVYWKEKIFLGLWATFWSDDLPKLFLLFIFIELLDIFTRWLAQSKKCYHALYPNMKVGLWTYFKFLWQARKWRFINSGSWRNGFCDKMLVYLLLFFLSATVDATLAIAHVPRALLTVVVTVLSTTEALSILENLSECGVEIIPEIKKRFKEMIK